MTQLLITLAQSPVAQPQQTGNGLLAWAIVLIGIAFVLFFIELFVPSGGIIAGISAICLVAGIIMLFGVNTNLGLTASVVSLIALPFLIGFAFKIWPNTPIGRWLTLGSSDDGENNSSTTATRDDGDLPVEVGATGKALTELRPVGTCLIDGRRQECLATGGLIPAGEKVKVVAVDGMQIKVRTRKGE